MLTENFRRLSDDLDVIPKVVDGLELAAMGRVGGNPGAKTRGIDLRNIFPAQPGVPVDSP
jgi:hypothetical protein